MLDVAIYWHGGHGGGHLMVQYRTTYLHKIINRGRPNSFESDNAAWQGNQFLSWLIFLEQDCFLMIVIVNTTYFHTRMAYIY